MKNFRPIKTENDYESALAEVAGYFENEPEPGSPEGDRFDVLATLIEAYEEENYPIPELYPIPESKLIWKCPVERRRTWLIAGLPLPGIGGSSTQAKADVGL